MKHFLTPLLFPLLLSGCATLSKNECLTADWATIGYEDGIQGKSQSRIGQHRKACADYDVSPDLSAYQRGHAEGVILFCTPHNGYNKGKQGNDYPTICPTNVEASFRKGYEAGREVYRAWSSRIEVLTDIENIEKQLLDIEEQIAEDEGDLFDGIGTKKERKKTYTNINTLKEDYYYLSEDYDDLQEQLSAADALLSKLKTSYRAYE